MLKAKDFVYAADNDQLFNVKVDETFFHGITRENMLAALDTAALYEEIYYVDFFMPSYQIGDMNDFSIPSINLIIKCNHNAYNSNVCMFAEIIKGMRQCAKYAS